MSSDKQINAATTANPIDTSDNALVVLLNRLSATVDSSEFRKISGEIERVVFHKQIGNT